jgi:hypothetical protein
MRKCLRFLFPLLGLILVTATGSGASAGTNTSLSTPSTPGFWVVAVSAALSAAAMPAVEPKDFPPNGFGCNMASDYYASWCGKYIVRGEYCDPEGCTIKDQITTKITVDPGVETSRVVYQSLYSPDNFDFTQIHFEWWTLCHNSAEVCGTANAPSFTGNASGKFSPTSSVSLYGDRLAHAFELWAFFEPTGQWVGNPGRTGTAACAEEPDRACVY